MAASDAADELLVELRAATARGDANGCRALGSAFAAAHDRAQRAAEGALSLREVNVRITQAQGELLVRAAEAAFAALSAEGVLPGGLVAIAKRRFGEELRRLNGGGEPVALPEPASVVAPPPMVPAFDEPDDEDLPDLEDGRDDAELLDDLAIDLDAAEEGLAADDAAPSAEDAEIPENELIPLLEVPLSYRSRFQLGAAGERRARVAFTRQRRAEEAQRAAAEQAAEAADDLRRKAAAAARAARPVGRAPAGWDSRGRRGGGPAGRAGP
jgi:hypothetical protein